MAIYEDGYIDGEDFERWAEWASQPEVRDRVRQIAIRLLSLETAENLQSACEEQSNSEL